MEIEKQKKRMAEFLLRVGDVIYLGMTCRITDKMTRIQSLEINEGGKKNAPPNEAMRNIKKKQIFQLQAFEFHN